MPASFLVPTGLYCSISLSVPGENSFMHVCTSAYRDCDRCSGAFNSSTAHKDLVVRHCVSVWILLSWSQQQKLQHYFLDCKGAADNVVVHFYVDDTILTVHVEDWWSLLLINTPTGWHTKKRIQWSGTTQTHYNSTTFRSLVHKTDVLQLDYMLKIHCTHWNYCKNTLIALKIQNPHSSLKGASTDWKTQSIWTQNFLNFYIAPTTVSNSPWWLTWEASHWTWPNGGW